MSLKVPCCGVLMGILFLVGLAESKQDPIRLVRLIGCAAGTLMSWIWARPLLLL